MPSTTTPELTDDVASRELTDELAGLDALELAEGPRRHRLRALWAATWPKLAAIAIGLLVWQIVVWSRLEARLRPARTESGLQRAVATA